MPNENQPQEGTSPEVELELDLDSTPEGDGTPDLAAQLEKEREARKQLTARAKKAEEALKKYQTPTQPTLEKKVDDDVHKSIAELKLAERKRQFGYEHSLSPDETDAIFRINPNPTKEDLENPFVKGGIDALRAKKRVESNTPSPSSKVFKVGGKTWGELSPTEKEANWNKRQEYLKGR